ncbi:MAG: ribosomal protection-like ABC-F family protein [Hyphomicrobiales bacterium]
MLLSLSKVSVIFGAQTVLSNVEFVLNAGERVGVVGANGTGKSTLLRVIAGERAPEAGGEVWFAPGAIAGHLPQQPPSPPAGTSIRDLVREAQGGLRALEWELREMEPRMAEPEIEPGAFEAVLERYGAVQEAFERRGGYEIEWRAAEVFAGLGIAHLPMEQAFETLSGGEKARVLLATLLLQSPDVLVLDEPTNHLDFGALEWLEGYLAGFKGGVLAVSHDRHFLNRVATRILEVEEHSHGVAEYAGNYDAYAEVRAKARARWAADYERQQEEIRELRHAIRVAARSVGHPGRAARDNDKFAKGFFGGRVDVAISRNVRSAEERLRRIEADPIPKPPDTLRIAPEFDIDALEGKRPVVVEGLRKCFGDRVVLDGVSFALGARERAVIVGPNGAGKSTLLNIIAGREEASAGVVRLSPRVRLGYLDQDARDLDPERTVFEAYREGQRGYRDALIRDLFRYGLFTLEDLEKPVRSLSTGQRRKLQLARLIALRANVLLLDEPTNHLGFDILEEFERALAGFEGPVLAVSHDRWFIERFGGAVWQLRDGRLVTGD